MPFEVRSSKKINKELSDFDSNIKGKILELIVHLKYFPVPINKYDVVKVKGSEYTYRVRLGKVRIIYDVLWKEKIIELLKVDKRKDRTYKNFN